MAGRQWIGPFTDIVFPVVRRKLPPQDGPPLRQNIDYHSSTRPIFIMCKKCAQHVDRRPAGVLLRMARKKYKYVVSGYLTISVTKVIEASSRREAQQIGLRLGCPSLCHQCDGAGEGDPECWTLNGFDDPPEDAVKSVELLRPDPVLE